MLLLIGIRRGACRPPAAFVASSWRAPSAAASRVPRFLSTDAPERTEQEKAAIQAAREAKK